MPDSYLEKYITLVLELNPKYLLNSHKAFLAINLVLSFCLH